MTKHRTFLRLALLLAVLALAASLSVRAEPVGAMVTNVSTSSRDTIAAGSMFNAGGTISTLNVSAIQQDLNWKAYVGNITGSLTLDDADNKTIYDWSFTTLTGEIYASRASSVTFTAANCSLTGNTSAEETALGFVSADSDNLARTFNQSTHTWFLTGINNMTGCNSTSTYVNDVRQAALPAADFQEAVLSDGINIIYASVFETDAVGYDDPATYDFQMIVPQNKSTLTGTTYYFWVELG